MTVTVGAFEAKTRLSELLAQVEAGEQVTITKHGRPVARLIPIVESPATRDWAEFWRGVDEHRASLPLRSTIRPAIDEGRA